MAGLVLAGCADGTSRNATRGRDQDAGRESVVKDLQATETWRLVNSTPPSTPIEDEE